MAEHGVILRDPSGRVFAKTGAGSSYFYWGKVTINMGGPNGQNKDVGLFNIPTYVPVALFTRGYGPGFNSGSEANLLPYDANGFWRLRRWDIAFDFSVVSLDVYVFVDARYMPASRYGLQLWDGAGVKIFDTTRPILQVAGEVRVAGQSGPAGNPTWYGAAPPSSDWALAHGGFTYTSTSQYATYWTAIGAYIYGFRVVAMPTYGTPVGLYVSTFLAIINRAYYDQFPNLGNM